MSGMSAFLLIASLVVQTAAAVTAVIIALRTGRVKGWLLLAIAMAMMALRRLASLAAPLQYRDYIAEGLALVTSILAVLGVILISGAFRRFHVSGEKLKKELQENERNRKMLEEREREYRTLVNNLPGFAYRCANDRDWTMLYISEGCTEVTGYSPEELLGNCMVAFNDLIDEEFQGRIWKKWQRTLSQRGVFQYEYPITTRQKTRRWVWEKGCGVFSEEGELLFLEGFIADITERRKAEEELQKVEKLASVGTLAGGIAHDFNNIMTGIYGNISMAREVLATGDRAAVFLEQAGESMERATMLTRQLLTFARGGEPRMESVDVASLIEETVHFDLSGSNVEPVFRWQSGLWNADADRSQLQQVASNLTLNAVEAMPRGGRLEIVGENYSHHSVDELEVNPGDYVRMVFRDHGCGIPADDLEKVFDPYFTTKDGGTGLGLATVYSVVRRHGGRITVSSESGKGTEFVILLPASASHSQNHEGDSTELPGKRSSRVLVMDDEDIVCQVALGMLEHLGYEAEAFPDGESAVEAYRKAMERGRPFDLVIMDLTVPGGVGGAEATRMILEFDPSARAIVSSGYSENPVMSSYRTYGFKGVMEKPYTLGKLRDTVSTVLQD